MRPVSRSRTFPLGNLLIVAQTDALQETPANTSSTLGVVMAGRFDSIPLFWGNQSRPIAAPTAMVQGFSKCKYEGQQKRAY
jgi:hypothetical protein